MDAVKKPKKIKQQVATMDLMENLANPQTPILKLFILTISTMTTSAAI
jgi:hypothetical protein